jgi:AcrR family transcriptional regulator
MDTLTDTLARRAVDRTVADRQSEYAREMQRIVDATYRVIERTGAVDPSLRDILRETGLSTQAFYRYFQSKDELLLLLLDDGRRRLLGYLEHQMQKEATPEGAVAAWIRGVLAQAADPAAASRTRPFLANQDRLAEAFPEEQKASVELLIGQLSGALMALGVPGGGRRRRRIDDRRDAEAVYDMVFGLLHRHLVEGTAPAAADVDHLVKFTLRAVNVVRERKVRGAQ